MLIFLEIADTYLSLCPLESVPCFLSWLRCPLAFNSIKTELCLIRESEAVNRVLNWRDLASSAFIS